MLFESKEPLGLESQNLCAVTRSQAQPVVSSREGLNTLKIIAAVRESTTRGGNVRIQFKLAQFDTASSIGGTGRN